MEDFFSKEFYGNTVGAWSIALIIIFASVLLAKVFFFVFGKVFRQFTKRTKTKLDDIILDKFEEPAVFGIIILGVWYGINTLHFGESSANLLTKAYYFLVTFNVAWFLSRLIDALIEEYLVPLVEKSESDLDDQLLPIARKSLRVVIWVLAIIIALNNAGYDVGALIAGLGIGGLAFALAAKDYLSNLFGGFVLFTDKPFTINDRIITNNYDGIVKEIGVRSSRIQTLDGRLVTIPNADIASNSIVNITSEPDRRVILDLGLTYDTSRDNIKKAMDLLKEISDNNPDLNSEKTVIAFTEFKDFSLNIKFIYYIKKGADIFGTMSALNLEILEKFNSNNLEFAFPTQTIHTINDSNLKN